MKNNFKILVLTAVVAFGIGMWTPQFSLRKVAAQTAPTLSGSYGFQGTAPVQPGSAAFGAALGVMTFDGSGNVTINQTYVETDTTAGATTVKVQPPGPITGTYTVNADSTGTMAINLGGDKPSPFVFVLTDGGAGLSFLQTGGSNTVLLGTARKI